MLSTYPLYQNINKACIFFFLFSLPFSTRLNGLSIIILTLIYLIGGDFRNKLKVLSTNLFGILMILFYLIYVIGILYTENIAAGEKILIKSLSIFLLPIILAPGKNAFKIKDLYHFFIIFLFSCLGLCLMQSVILLDLDFWIQGVAPSTAPNNEVKSIIINSTIHPTYFGMYLNFIIQVLLFFVYKFGKKLPKLKIILIVGLILFFTYFIIQGLSRINIILLALTLSVYFIILLSKHFTKLILVVIYLGFIISFFATVLLIPAVNDKLFVQLINFKIEYPNYYNGWNATNLRIAEWSCAIENIKTNLLLGVGTGDGQDALDACYKKIEFWNFTPPYFNCHNQYLQISLTNGLLGLTTLLMVFLTALAHAFKKENLIYIGFVISVMLISVTESIFMVQKGIVFFSFFSVMLSYYDIRITKIKDL